MLSNDKGKAKKQSGKQSEKYGDGAAQTAGAALNSMQLDAGSPDRESTSGESMQSSTREQQIAVMAYFKAEQRRFQDGGELGDWLAAEQEFDSTYLARTMGQQSDEP